jgi:type I restriction enzyme M protein
MLNAETKRRIDNARDILVGKVPDPKTQVEQITFAMIYKFMDDMDQLSVQLGGKASFFANGYKAFAWSKLMDKRISGAARLDLYVRALEQMAQNPHIPQLFRDVFKGAFLPYRDSETLNLFLKEMNGFTYQHSEDLGDAYEYLLSIFATQGKAGQFRTPRHIIDFIVDCVDPGMHDTVLDPACGTAGFLISAYKHILEKHTENPLTPDQKQRLTENFVGYDISPDMVRLSRVNMYLHQFPNPTIHEYDTLTTEDRWEDTFDVILANPPFMTPTGGIRPHKRFAVRANRSEVLFVDYITEHLNVGGRAGVIVPEGIIFQSSNAYKALRKMLVEENYLYAVVSLPAGIFNPYSGVKTSILLMDKDLAKQRDSILFVKVENDGYDLGAQRNPIEENDLPEALKVVKAFQKDPEIKINNSDLSILVEKFKLSDSEDYNLSLERYRANVKISKNWPMVPLSKIVDIETGSREKGGAKDFGIPSIGGGQIDDQGTITYENMVYVSEDHFNNMSRGILKQNDVLMVKDGATTGKIGFFKDKIDAAVNEHVYIIRAKSNALPIYLYQTLRSKSFQSNLQPYIKGIIGGVSLEIKEIKIPLPPLEVQQEIVDEIEGYQKVIDGARQVVENYKPVIHIDPDWPLVKLGEVISLEYGKPLRKDKRIPGEYPVFGSNGIIGYHNEYLVKGPFIIVGRKGSAGAVTYSEKSGFPIDTTFFVRILNEETLDLRFIYYQLLNLELEKVNVQSGVPGLNRNDAYEKLVALPSLVIQKEIISRIEEEEQLVETNRKIITLFESKIIDRIKRIWEQ